MPHRRGWRDIPRRHDRPRSAADPRRPRRDCGHWRPPGSNWHQRQSPHHRPVPRRCSAAGRSRTAAAAHHSRGSGHGGSSRRSSGQALSHQAPTGKTSDTPGSSGPLRTAAVPSGCRSSSRRSACGSAAPDRSKAFPSHYRRVPGVLEPHRAQRSDRSRAADASQAHAVRAKTRRTTRPAGLGAPHHRLPPGHRDLRKSVDYTTAIPVFFDTTAPFATFAAALGSNGSSPPTHVLMLIIWQRLTDSIVPGRRHGPGRFEQFCALQKGDQRHHSVLRSHENETNLCWLGAWLRRASSAPDSGVSGTQRRAAYFLGFSLQLETKAEMTSCPLRL